MRCFKIALYMPLLNLVAQASGTSSFKDLHRVGSFHINHRHGGSTVNGNGDTIDFKDFSDESEIIITQLCNMLVADSGKNGGDNKIQEASLWKRLGKLCLDSGEYAEASRIFRRGAERCPEEEGLCHHAKVFCAFHGSQHSIPEEELQQQQQQQKKTSSPPPLQLRRVPSSDLFLSLDVPPENVPNSVIAMAKRNGCNMNAIRKESFTKLLHASTEPILSREACQYIIECADEVAKRQGWTKDRHVHAPTCDIPVFDLDPAAIQWIRNAMKDVLFPLLERSFPGEIGIETDKLRIQDLFVVRYDGNEDKPGFSSLRPHEDESIISLTIALNDMSSYEGGGMFIASTGDLLNGDAGTVLTFAGELVHGGYPVTKGTRWIMTVFLYLDDNLSGKDPGYILKKVDSTLTDK